MVRTSMGPDGWPISAAFGSEFPETWLCSVNRLMFQIVSAFSGEAICTLNAEEVNGKSTKALKTWLFSMTGISRFRQRLLLEDGSEIVEEEELSLTPQAVQLVLLQFPAPSLVQEETLIAACRRDDIQLLETCLAEPQDPNLPFEFSDGWNGVCAIHVAACGGSLQCLHVLLEAGADKDSTDAAQATPLFVAAKYGRIEIVRVLVEAGADMHKAMNDGSTPLHVAAQNGHMNVVRFLVQAGTDMNQAWNDGGTPLFQAASSPWTR